MKPFSPMYFVKENRTRCMLLMFMIFLSYAVYLGGLYITNPMDSWELPIEYCESVARVYPTNFYENYEEYEKFWDEMEKNEKVTVIEGGLSSNLTWKTVMGFETGGVTYAFQTPEDFRTYCEYMGIACDFTDVKNGSMIMSERFAKNQGLELGDSIDKDYSDYVYDTYTLDALTQEAGYILYLIDNEPYTSDNLLLLGNGISGEELYDIIYDVRKTYNVSVQDMLEQQVRSQFDTFSIIYGFIVIFLSLILAVTIHAAFVGMYQRRNLEFAVYRAIGISWKKIIGKIVGELLLMDLITLMVGGFIFFLGLYLVNHMVLYPAGLYLRYYHPMAVFGLLLCNVTVLAPLIVTRCRQMLRADICEY